jgi:di/tricarboxylate transporter
VFLLWTLMISHILIETDIHAMKLEIAMLTIAVIFGIILIRYVFYSIEQTKRIEELNSELKQAYSKIHNLNNEL